MSELQEAVEDVQVDNVDQASEAAEPADTGSELATDSPIEGEKNTEEDSKKQADDLAQKAINKQHKKFRDEQRRADELQKKLDSLKPQTVTASDVVVPPIPDSWDENYEQLIRDRDAAIERKAQVNAERQIQADIQAKAQKLKQAEEQNIAQKRNDVFMENATKLGLNHESLMDAQNTVLDYGITPQLAAALIDDPDGPLIVQHLAANPMDLYELVTTDPLLAGMKLASIKASTAALKPKPTAAPDPADTLSGRGPKDKERGPKGSVYK